MKLERRAKQGFVRHVMDLGFVLEVLGGCFMVLADGPHSQF
jgi:hypothetical protein